MGFYLVKQYFILTRIFNFACADATHSLRLWSCFSATIELSTVIRMREVLFQLIFFFAN